VSANSVAGRYSVAAAAWDDVGPAIFNLANGAFLTVRKAGAGAGSVTSVPAGIDCGLTCTWGFDYSIPVALTATAAGGSQFEGWSGACEGAGSCSVTLDADRQVTATFEPAQYTIAVSAQPAAGGVVGGGGTYGYGATATVAAAANAGYTFVSWTEGGAEVSTDASYSFPATADRTLVAHFALAEYTVAVSADPPAGGAVGGGGVFRRGETVTVTATPHAGYAFVHWTEGGAPFSTYANCSFAVTADRTLVAHFALKAHTVAVSADPPAGGAVSGGGTFDYGVYVTVVAVPNTGYSFVNWTEDGAEVARQPSYSFTATANRTLVAHFAKDEYRLYMPFAKGS
jgi:hypothetical protein